MKYIKPGMKGLSMIRQVSFIVAVLSVCSFAAPDTTSSRLDDLEGRVENILSIAGIQFGGEFRSQFLFSGLDSEKKGVAPNFKKNENVEFTSVDFQINARPNDVVNGKVILRLHQDWRNFFSDVGNPIVTRWVGIGGNVKNMFLYDIGDFKQKYSPLTLYTPEIEIDFEPEIFAAKRQYAMDEKFLGNNQRILQGVNFTFAAQIEPLFKKFYAQAIGARLRLSNTGETYVVAPFESANMDRYAIGFNTDMEIIDDLKLGGTFLSSFDAPNTFSNNSATPQFVADTMAQRRFVTAFRGGIGTATFIESDIFDFSLNGEIATSADKDSNKVEFKENTAILDNDTVTTYDTTTSFSWVTGNALNLNLTGDVKLGSSNKLSVNAGVILNQDKFKNELAQSPSFIGNRIMNSENDIPNHRYNLYSTFDAMYNTVFKFAPGEGNEQFDKKPMTKISYTNATLNKKELDHMQSSLVEDYGHLFMMDPALQLVMPYGKATPNRVGFDLDFSASLMNDGVKAKVSAASFSEEKPATIVTEDGATMEASKSKFLEIGAGGSVDIASFTDALNTLRLSGSYKFSERKNDSKEMLWAESGISTDINSAFANAGLYWNFYKRFSFLFGYQNIVTKFAQSYLEEGSAVESDLTITQNQWASGIEYKIERTGSVITGTIGQIVVSEDNSEENEEESEEAFKRDFAQWQTEVFLTVPF